MRLTELRTTGEAFEMFVLVGMVVNWLAHATKIPAVAVIVRSLTHAAAPLIELLSITMVVLSLLGVLLYTQIGETVLIWSSFGSVTGSMWRNFIIGAQLFLSGSERVGCCWPRRPLSALHNSH